MVRKEQIDLSNKANCKWRETLELIGDKWTVRILRALCHEQLRYSQLHRQVPGISQKVLTASLRELERSGIVKRTVYPVVPPRVEYQLTTLGYSVFDVVDALHIWSLDHLPEIQSARIAYDARMQLPNEPLAVTIPSVATA